MRSSGRCGRCPGCLGRKVATVVPTRGPGGTRRLQVKVISPEVGGGGTPVLARHVEGVEGVTDEEYAHALYMQAIRNTSNGNGRNSILTHTGNNSIFMSTNKLSSSNQGWGQWFVNSIMSWKSWLFGGNGGTGSTNPDVIDSEVSEEIERLFSESSNPKGLSSSTPNQTEDINKTRVAQSQNPNIQTRGSNETRGERVERKTDTEYGRYLNQRKDIRKRMTRLRESHYASRMAPNPTQSDTKLNQSRDYTSRSKPGVESGQGHMDQTGEWYKGANGKWHQKETYKSSNNKPVQMDLFNTDGNQRALRNATESRSHGGTTTKYFKSANPITSDTYQTTRNTLNSRPIPFQLDLFNQYFHSSIVSINLNKGSGERFKSVRRAHIYEEASQILNEGHFGIAFVQEIGAPTYPTWKLKLDKYAGYENSGNESGIMWDPSYLTKIRTISDMDRKIAFNRMVFPRPLNQNVVNRSCAVLLETKAHPPQQVLAISWHGPANCVKDETKMATFAQLQHLAFEIRNLIGTPDIPIVIGGDFNLDLRRIRQEDLIGGFEVVHRLSDLRQGKNSVDGFLFAGNVELTSIRQVAHAGNMDHCPQNPIMSFKNIFPNL